jgi:hypothetical protein
VTTALLFGLLLQLGIWGQWLVPAVVPTFLTGSAWAGAGLVWLGSQFSLYRQWRFVFSLDVRAEFDRLIEQADAAWSQNDLKTARQILIVARSLDDEDVGVNVRWARLLEREGQLKAARSAWQRVLRLGPDEAESEQARQALATAVRK